MADINKRVNNIYKINQLIEELAIPDKTFNLIWMNNQEVAKLLDELQEIKNINQKGE